MLFIQTVVKNIDDNIIYYPYIMHEVLHRIII